MRLKSRAPICGETGALKALPNFLFQDVFQIVADVIFIVEMSRSGH